MKIYILLFLLTSLGINFTLSKKFLFSVIISIYNTGRYLDDSIGSLIKQTIGFDKIQIILVNDGSIDETEEICIKYKNKYPKNIMYLKIEHSGVSVGRNIGIKYIEGEFINFLDADDKWDKNAFKLAFLFFRYYKKINIVGCRMIFFEASNSYHPLDYKFYKTRVVNLTIEYNCIQLSTSSGFFRYSLIKNKYFKEGISNGEDTRFINNILLKKPVIGLIKEAIYYYRRRKDSTSAIQNKAKNEKFYSFIIKSVDVYLIEKSLKLYKRIPPFIQFYLAYNTLFRIIVPLYMNLQKTKFNSYCKLIENIINHIEDKYILEQKILSEKEKLFLLSKKYKIDIRNHITFVNKSLIYSGYKFFNLTENKKIIIWILLEIINDTLHLEGKDNFFLSPDTYFYYCQIGNKIIYPKYYYYSGYDINTMYGIISKGRIVVFNIPIKNFNFQKINFFLFYKGITTEIFPSFGWYTHLPNILGGYYHYGDYLLKIIDRRINIFKYNNNLEEFFEKAYCKQLKIINKNNLIYLRNNSLHFRRENKHKNEIWLINDKLTSARDNGEYFFRFLKKKKPKNIIFYFVIKGNCFDYKRLQPFGNIIDYGSNKYLNIFLNTDKLISSIYEDWVDNPFQNDHRYIRDLIHFDFIFIQHGIIKDDLSNYINRISKNFRLIITSTNKEYKSFLKKEYGYKRNNVIITGMPRYDNLNRMKNNVIKEKILLIFPTWRMYIKGTYDSRTFESIHSINFNSTNYFKFFNNLINNEELLLAMEKFGYIGILCLHPYFSKQYIDFNSNRYFSIIDLCDYQNLLLNSSLLITDYSSIFFDFAYLEKPIIYTHFDYEEYRINHYIKGYFDYFRHGFGPICYNIRCTINHIILQFQKNCSVDFKYLKRIKRFFKYKDENNCKRLYNALINDSYIKNLENNKAKIYIITFFSILILLKFIIIIY